MQTREFCRDSRVTYCRRFFAKASPVLRAPLLLQICTIYYKKNKWCAAPGSGGLGWLLMGGPLGLPLRSGVAGVWWLLLGRHASRWSQ